MTTRQALWTVGVLMFAAFGVLLWQMPSSLELAVRDFEARVGPLNPRAHAPEPVTDDVNAAHWLMLGSPAQFSQNDYDLLQRARGADLAVDRKALNELVERYRENVETLTKAADLDESALEIDYMVGWEAPMPDLARLLQGMKLLDAVLRVAVDADDPETAKLAFRALGSLRTVLLREPLVVSQILGISVDETYLRSLELLIESDLLDEPLRERVLRELDPEERDRQFAAAIAVEASWILNSPNQRKTWRQAFTSMELSTVLKLYARLPEAARLPPHEVEEYVRTNPPLLAKIGVLAKMVLPNLVDVAHKESKARRAREQARQRLQGTH